MSARSVRAPLQMLPNALNLWETTRLGDHLDRESFVAQAVAAAIQRTGRGAGGERAIRRGNP
jgi:hypothetical protein